MKNKYDVVIIGGGLTGCTLALLLAKHTLLKIAIIDHTMLPLSEAPPLVTKRVSAISLAAQRLLDYLDVWQALGTVSPFQTICVEDQVHGSYLSFHAADIQEALLGFIVENRQLATCLHTKLLQCPHIAYLAPTQLVNLQVNDQTILLETAENGTLQATLAIGADGSHSQLRHLAGITTQPEEEETQSAIVATVHVTSPYEKIARQWFLHEHILAFLPLDADKHQQGQYFSIVWSLPQQEADRLMALSDPLFIQTLSQATLSAQLPEGMGTITLQDKRCQLAFCPQQAMQYIRHRIALVGDAAHVAHPLAGQGLTLGLLDAASLAEILTVGMTQQQDLGSVPLLQRYERWRRADNWAMLAGIQTIKQLFSDQSLMINSLRAQGLKMLPHLSGLKQWLIRYAVGNRMGLPQVAQRQVSDYLGRRAPTRQKLADMIYFEPTYTK